jgi:NNP family nitrate/nitrite transporter-like MFS transporter
MGGAMADAAGVVKKLSGVFIVAAFALAGVSGAPTVSSALVLFVIAMLALGAGNGAVFQLVPQRFGKEIGIMTGLVGMAGGVGGFYLASSLGFSNQVTGNYQTGFLVFAALALTALAGLTLVKGKWRSRWDSIAKGVRI